MAFHLSDFSFKKVILQKAGFGWMPEYMIQQELKDGLLQIILWEQSSVQELHPKLYFSDEKLLGKAGKQLLTYFSTNQKKPSFLEGAKPGLNTKANHPPHRSRRGLLNIRPNCSPLGSADIKTFSIFLISKHSAKKKSSMNKAVKNVRGKMSQLCDRISRQRTCP